MSLASKLSFAFAVFMGLSVAVGQSHRAGLRIEVVDAETSRKVPDVIVTVNGQVVPADSVQSYVLPGDAARIRVRAPGYRAATFTSEEAVGRNEVLPLTPLRCMRCI